MRFVPRTGLEPAHLAELPPQSSVSTNFTTWALKTLQNIRVREKLTIRQAGKSKKVLKLYQSEANKSTESFSLVLFD
jgi:hypothetical protein